MVNIALLGHGVVGSGVAEIILNNIEKFKNETGPAIAAMFKEEGVDAVILTAG